MRTVQPLEIQLRTRLRTGRSTVGRASSKCFSCIHVSVKQVAKQSASSSSTTPTAKLTQHQQQQQQQRRQQQQQQQRSTGSWRDSQLPPHKETDAYWFAEEPLPTGSKGIANTTATSASASNNSSSTFGTVKIYPHHVPVPPRADSSEALLEDSDAAAASDAYRHR
jgi:hypothetical protein